MTLKDKLIFGAVVVVVAIIAGWGMEVITGVGPNFGSVGNLLAENYINYVRQNGGYNSADPIATTNTFSASTVSASGGTIVWQSTLGNVTTQLISGALTAATTTPCNLQNGSATTTVLQFTFDIGGTGTTAPAWLTVATSSTSNATTSYFASFKTGVSQVGPYTFGESTSTGVAMVLPPNAWVNVGSVATTSSYTSNGVYTIPGNCEMMTQSVF